jgi:regulator of RNase E activity RraA
VGGEVEVGGDEGVVVREGDFLFGDLNGVVCLPVECVEEAIGLLGGLVEADRRVAEEIGRGGLVWEAMEKWRRK